MKRILSRRWAILGALVVCFAAVSVGGVQAGDRKTNVITFASSATHTAGATTSSGFLVGKYQEAVILINVTTVTGTPTLDIDIETSDDNTMFYHHTRLDTIRIVDTIAFKISNFGKYVRVVHTVAGSTSMTYTIKGVFKN